MADEDEEVVESTSSSGPSGKKMAKPNYGALWGLSPVEVFETGVIPLDIVLGGGYTKGDMIQLSSPSGVGKSTLFLNVVKNLLSMGQRVCYCDVETGVKQGMLSNYGLLDKASSDPKEPFLFIKPKTYTDMDRVLDDTVYHQNFQHLFIDSITSLMPSKLRDKPVEEIEIGLQARLSAALLLKWKSALRERGVTCWLVNQARIKSIGTGRNIKFVLGGAGGKAQDHYPDIRLFAREGERLMRVEQTVSGEQKVPYGNIAGLWAEKNRADRPYIVVPCPVLFGKGVSNIMFMKTILQENGWISGGAGGNYRLTLPDGTEEKISGTDNIEKKIKEMATTLKAAMKEAGLFDLVKVGKDGQ